MVEGIVGLAAVAKGKVEETVGPENGISRVVVPIRLWDLKEEPLVFLVRFAGVLLAHAPFHEAASLWVLQGVV